MRKVSLVLLTVLAFTTLASGQTIDPQKQIEQLIGSLIIANTNAQYQLSQAKAEIDGLKKQIEEAKKPAASDQPPPLSSLPDIPSRP